MAVATQENLQSRTTGTELQARRFKITVAMKQRHGNTPGCNACVKGVGMHTEECRLRFAALYPEKSAGAVANVQEEQAAGGSSSRSILQVNAGKWCAHQNSLVCFDV